MATSVVMKPDSGGVFRLGTRRTVVLPVALRRLCGVTPGDDVLLVADPEHGVLVVHPLYGAGPDDPRLPRLPDRRWCR